MKTETLQEEDGITYTRTIGGWESFERNVPLGTLRIIEDHVYKAWLIYNRFMKAPRIVWSTLNYSEVENLKKLLRL